jgi:hypothetical protein
MLAKNINGLLFRVKAPKKINVVRHKEQLATGRDPVPFDHFSQPLVAREIGHSEERLISLQRPLLLKQFGPPVDVPTLKMQTRRRIVCCLESEVHAMDSGNGVFRHFETHRIVPREARKSLSSYAQTRLWGA